MQNNLLERQLKLETECLALGQEKYYKRLEGNKSFESSPVEFSWVRNNTPALAEFIDEKLKLFKGSSKARQAAKGKKACLNIQDFDPQMLAHHTLRLLVDPEHLEQDKAISSCAIALSNFILSEINFRRLDEKQHDKYRAHQKTLQDHMRQKFSVNQLLLNAGVAPLMWDTAVKVHVGVWLLEAAIELFNYWEQAAVTKGKYRKNVLRPKQELIEWLNSAHSYMSTLKPLKMPMVHPPLDWTNMHDGGYISDVFSRDKSVKTLDDNYSEALDAYDLEEFYRAINLVQATPYKVNKTTLDVAQWCWDNNIRIGSEGKEILPSKLNLEIPAYPADWRLAPKDMKMQHPEVYKRYAVRAAIVFDQNSRMIGKRVASNTTLSIAEKFKDEEAIYFPHSADFRGRIYPLPHYFQPQGTDLAKGLMLFAEGKPLGEDGAFWLHVHAANCWGVDKVSNDERVEWTMRNMEAILDSAMNPKDGAGFWMEADKPFSALAVALELLQYQVQGDEMLSYIPIAMDGSCNGLQNFSAMLRDPIGAKATNLVPGEKPNDIYQDVADLVVKKIRRDSMTGNKFAAIWDGHITRSTVKQPVMTLPYGATQNGMRDQILNWLKKNHPNLFAGNQNWAAAGYLSLITYEAIQEVVVAARVAMDYLKKVASVVSQSGLPLRWDTPVGFPVLQHYKRFKSRRLCVHINGKKTQVSLNTDEYTLDKRKQGMGVSPNLIHSLDSSHLMLTVLQAADNGVTTFSMVHDSYATHACDTSTLQACTRDSFVDMYQGNVLQSFHDSISEQLEPKYRDKLPPVPEMGNFNLDLIKDSQYFFA
ncbi:DNA-directed RNA polymerase [Marinicella marina]|uniref:DNA-directed RNA polymerase n=1 Tax=Marinicella marina TaxID=2996016 RepID=UPI0024BD29E3|nr:DNA-directed RNA polymerase [Marinicella marina]MDJ1139659.1 hypothetical protein [Marinicella marina]